MARRRSRAITVDVEIDVILSDIDDTDIREEFEARFGIAGHDPGLLADVREALLRHRPAAALALIESAMFTHLVSDEARLRQYAQAERAH